MGGGLISFGEALKAFRRGVHQFPHAWLCVVVCGGHTQRNYAFGEAAKILEGGSLPVEHVNHAGLQIKVAKGGELRFIHTDEPDFFARIAGVHAPHIISVSGLADQTEERLRVHNRSAYVDQKYCRFDHCTL